MHQFDLKRLTQLEDPFVAVKLPEHNAPQSGVGDQLEAAEARRCGHVNVPRLDPDTATRSLRDGIRLRVDRANAMPVLHQVTDVITMRQASKATVVACRKQHLVSHHDRTDVLSVASRARRDDAGNCHEVFVPGGARPVGHRSSGRRIARKRNARNPRLDLSAGSWLLPPVHVNFMRLLIVWPVAAIALLTASRASADDNDPTAIEQRLKALESTPERQAILRDPAVNARKVLKRVLDARAAGDAPHSVELAALADEWVKLAANVVRAIELEKELAVQQTLLTDLDQKRRRTETLLEATIAQRERNREEILRMKAERAAKLATPPTAVAPASHDKPVTTATASSAVARPEASKKPSSPLKTSPKSQVK